MRAFFCLIACLIGLAALPAPERAQAQDGTYDMDCAVILCMAGGWPAVEECNEAYSYMLSRIRDIPPKPPFGTCLMSDGTDYTGFDLDYTIGATMAKNAYGCPADTILYYMPTDTTETVIFCYERTVEYINEDHVCKRKYTGITEATFRELDATLTVEPDTDSEFAAPETIVETKVAAPDSYEELCTPETAGSGYEGEAPVVEGCTSEWSPPAKTFCDFAFPIPNAAYSTSDPKMHRVSCGGAPGGDTALTVQEYAGSNVSVTSIGRHEFPAAMRNASVARLSADFYIPSDYDWTFAGRMPIGINMGPWTSGGKTGSRQTGSSVRLHVWPDNGGTLGLYSYNFDRTGGTAGSSEWGQGVAKVDARLPRDEWITVTIEVALDTPGADRDAATIYIHDSDGNLIGSDTSGKSLTYRRAGDTFGFTGAIFDSKLNNNTIRARQNQRYYVNNWQGQACQQQ